MAKKPVLERENKMVKKLDKKYYCCFCYSWQERLKKKFPNGMPITEENLEWVKRYKNFEVNVSSALDVMGKYELSHKWLWDIGDNNGKKLIHLILDMVKNWKLTPELYKKHKIKLW